jgi:hypothetical protein
VTQKKSKDDNELTRCHLLQAQPKKNLIKNKIKMTTSLGSSIFSTQP